MRTVNVSIKQYPELFLNANAYREIFYELLINPNKLGTECNSISAIMVNGLLAAELYLKYLISFDQAEENLKRCTGDTVQFDAVHSIYSLFLGLKRERKSKIKKRVIELGCSEKKWRSFLARIKRANQYNQNDPEGKNGDAINYRYLITKGKYSYKYDLNTLVKLVEALYEMSKYDFNYIREGNVVKLKVCTKGEIKLSSFASPALDEISQSIIEHNNY